MAVRGKHTHYRLHDIQRRHFIETASRCGLGSGMEQIIDEVSGHSEAVLEQVGRTLPPGFPEDVFIALAEGLRASAATL
jgi:serine/threonine-protein kinase HipA